MPFSPLLVFHVSAGTLGMLSGTAAMSFRKRFPPAPRSGKRAIFGA
jgi:hypothetical protein